MSDTTTIRHQTQLVGAKESLSEASLELTTILLAPPLHHSRISTVNKFPGANWETFALQVCSRIFSLLLWSRTGRRRPASCFIVIIQGDHHHHHYHRHRRTNIICEPSWVSHFSNDNNSIFRLQSTTNMIYYYYYYYHCNIKREQSSLPASLLL